MGLQPFGDAFSLVQSFSDLVEFIEFGQHDAGKIGVFSSLIQSSGELIPQHFICMQRIFHFVVINFVQSDFLMDCKFHKSFNLRLYEAP